MKLWVFALSVVVALLVGFWITFNYILVPVLSRKKETYGNMFSPVRLSPVPVSKNSEAIDALAYALGGY